MIDGTIPDPEPADFLSAMDDSVAVINEVVDGTISYDPPQGLAGLVEANVSHLETMTVDRVDELGESPNLSSYETAIAAGKTYLESA
tara:strand:+ start:1621 stop:1881 length:261 start_codon:yes stop_codon:yes gene_type:complete